MLNKQFKIFLHMHRVSVVLIVEVFLLLTYLIYQVSAYNIHLDVVWFIHKTQAMCPIIFFFSMYISYEYMHGIKTSGIEEAVTAYPSGRAKLYTAGFFVLMTITLLILAIMSFFPIMVVAIANAPTILYSHILTVSTLNTLLPSILANLLGAFFALTLKRIKAYSLMATVIFIMLPASDLIPRIANDGYHINIWPIKALFSDTLPPNLNWTIDYQYGISNESFRWNIVLFWMLLFAGFVLFCILSHKSKLRMPAATLCIALSIVNLYQYSLSSSKIDLSESPTSVFRTDQVYYNQHVPKETEAKFEITAYDMKFDIDRELNAEVTMEISSPQNLNEYEFTLYNRYNILSMKDENNIDLSFSRDGDYISVIVENSVKSITMEYKGYSPMFYSNRQGVCLPGCFPYYPWAGYRKIYYYTPEDEVGVASFIARSDLPEAAFNVAITGANNLQSNLFEENGQLHGKTKSLSVMGGFLEAKDFGPYHTVICSISRDSWFMNTEYLDALQAEITTIERERNIEDHINLTEYLIFQGNETIINRASYGFALLMDNHIFLLPGFEPHLVAEEIVRQKNDDLPLLSKDKLALMEKERQG